MNLENVGDMSETDVRLFRPYERNHLEINLGIVGLEKREPSNKIGRDVYRFSSDKLGEVWINTRFAGEDIYQIVYFEKNGRRTER